MWVRIKLRNKPLEFIKLDDMNHLFVGTYPVPTMVKDKETQEWVEDEIDTIGIFFNVQNGLMCLLEFQTIQEAEESLLNLFRAWSACRSSLFLIPEGTSWLIEPVGLKQKREV